MGGSLWGWEDLDRGSWANKGVYSGCMGWVPTPPPSLAAFGNFFMNFQHSSIFL
jgi:hypothetical protein